MRYFLFLCFFMSNIHHILAQDNVTFILMEANDKLKEQTWFYSGSGEELQQSEIKKYWEQDKYITAASYTENGWFVTMSQNDNYTGQSYHYSSSWPTDWIKEKYDAKHYITSITCSESKWFIVMSKVKNYTGQRYKQDVFSKLKVWYDKNRDEGYYITQATYSSGKWLWVMTKGSEITSQGYAWATNDNVTQKIKQIWNEGNRVHLVEYADGEYFIPYGSTRRGAAKQSYTFRTSGISDWISKNWQEGISIQYLGGGNPTSSGSSTATASRTVTTGNNTTNDTGRRSWRQNNPNGGYVDYVQNPDGSIDATAVNPCIICGGSKVCRVCNGQGGVMGRAYGGTWYPCKACGGSKVCQSCRGQGYTTLVSHFQNGVSIGYDQNGNVYSSGGGNGSGSPSNSTPSRNTSTGSGVCPDCGGKGYRPESYRYAASSSFAPYHNTGGSTCNICGGTTDHYHYRCTTCKRH